MIHLLIMLTMVISTCQICDECVLAMKRSKYLHTIAVCHMWTIDKAITIMKAVYGPKASSD